MTARRRPTVLPGLAGSAVASRALIALALLILVELVVANVLNLLPQVVAIDFYQYWAVGAAPRLTSQPLGSPYTDHRTYTEVVRAYAERSNETRLTVNGRVLGPTGFTATPLAYLLFAALPADYGVAVTFYQLLALVLFASSVVVLGVLNGHRIEWVVCLALLMVLASGPFLADWRLGNIGSAQLAALALLLYLAVRLPREPAAPVRGAVVLAGLTVLAIVKPNVALLAMAMAAHLWAGRGTRLFGIAVVAAALAAAIAVIIPCVYFGSWTIWPEWYWTVFGRSPYTLARPSSGGNYSPPLLIARALGLDVWWVGAAIAAMLGLSLVAVVLLSGPPRTRGWATFRDAPRRVFGDPQLAMAIGVTLTVALPLLVWYHYHVLVLIPGLWLLSAPAGSRSLALCGGVALALSSGVLNVLFLPLGWTGVAAGAAALTFVPLWAGILLHLHASGAGGPTGDQ